MLLSRWQYVQYWMSINLTNHDDHILYALMNLIIFTSVSWNYILAYAHAYTFYLFLIVEDSQFILRNLCFKIGDNVQADENLRSVRSKLPQAVETCIDAAGHEFDVSRQRTLLRAASYGRAFCKLVSFQDPI